MDKIKKIRNNRATAPDNEFYEPHSTDPIALRIPCPICPADVGEWCGGFNDLHIERKALVQ